MRRTEPLCFPQPLAPCCGTLHAAPMGFAEATAAVLPRTARFVLAEVVATMGGAEPESLGPLVTPWHAASFPATMEPASPMSLAALVASIDLTARAAAMGLAIAANLGRLGAVGVQTTLAAAVADAVVTTDGRVGAMRHDAEPPAAVALADTAGPNALGAVLYRTLWATGLGAARVVERAFSLRGDAVVHGVDQAWQVHVQEKVRYIEPEKIIAGMNGGRGGARPARKLRRTTRLPRIGRRRGPVFFVAGFEVHVRK
ncbi:Aste57867_10867 [Aphanomyces stellatus]|uniref:Aste57867_10867 protein n=1 Tax=Aphanomyces stellatus TaxID=120398 RepID=A0A485KT46_9STRA|nr:hypothetical protein As57867_010827 [Aphanomyces stellatus]VFT87735.1 Aste57867_10867 [Aphanomyces stellatus]